MRWICQSTALIAWSLWLGGLVTLFVVVEALFRLLPRESFIETAPRIFLAFERYQLLLAGLALLGTFGWRVAAPHASRSRGVTAIFALLAAATIGALVSSMVLTPRLEQLRQTDQLGTPEFGRLHATSMLVYSAEVLLLVAAGLVMPGALRTITSFSPPASLEGAEDAENTQDKR